MLHYAENSDVALELATESTNRTDKDFDDGSDDTNFSYDEMIVETEEEDITIPIPSPLNPNSHIKQVISNQIIWNFQIFPR